MASILVLRAVELVLKYCSSPRSHRACFFLIRVKLAFTFHNTDGSLGVGRQIEGLPVDAGVAACQPSALQ